MTISEILGLVLAVIGVAFAFQTPRTWFLRVARLSRSDHSHIDDESPRITLSSNEAPTMIEEFISSSPAPTDGATIANDSGLHKLPHLWMQTNHSNADIIWVTEVAKRNQIGSIASHYYGQLIQGVTQIEKAAHTETSDVYRICNPSDVRHAICLKVFRRLQDADQLRRLCAVQKQIAGSGIFQDYSEYLRPLTTTTGADWVQPEDGHTKQAIAFRFLNEAKTKEATHFKGLSEQEIESVAEKFGRINDVFLNSSLGNLCPVHFAWDPGKWDKLIKKALDKDTPQTRTIYLARKEIKLIRRVRNLARSLSEESKRVLSLNDLHPHNVFIVGGKCVLIIDYEAVRSDWPEEATCGFALHRFCREYVRIIYESRQGGLDIKSVIKTAIAAFLRGYSVARPDAVQSIQRIGMGWAKALNFAKLMNIIDFSANAGTDPSQRSEEQHFQEAVKFISYLMELELFEDAIGELPAQ